MCSAASQCNWLTTLLNSDSDASVADDNDGVTYGIIAGFAILALILIGGVWWQRKLRLDGRAETANDYVDDSLDTTGKAAAPVANAEGGRGRGTRNRDGAAFNNPMYNEVSISAVSAAAGAASMRSLRPAHVSSSSIGAAFGVGDRVEIVDKGAGTVRFVGLHHVEGTPRLGVELDAPNGKNNGTIKGYRYFSCQPGHGTLVKPQKATACGSVDAPPTYATAVGVGRQISDV